jgi:hypothetical protein
MVNTKYLSNCNKIKKNVIKIFIPLLFSFKNNKLTKTFYVENMYYKVFYLIYNHISVIKVFFKDKKIFYNFSKYFQINLYIFLIKKKSMILNLFFYFFYTLFLTFENLEDISINQLFFRGYKHRLKYETFSKGWIKPDHNLKFYFMLRVNSISLYVLNFNIYKNFYFSKYNLFLINTQLIYKLFYYFKILQYKLQSFVILYRSFYKFEKKIRLVFAKTNCIIYKHLNNKLILLFSIYKSFLIKNTQIKPKFLSVLSNIINSKNDKIKKNINIKPIYTSNKIKSLLNKKKKILNFNQFKKLKNYFLANYIFKFFFKRNFNLLYFNVFSNNILKLNWLKNNFLKNKVYYQKIIMNFLIKFLIKYSIVSKLTRRYDINNKNSFYNILDSFINKLKNIIIIFLINLFNLVILPETVKLKFINFILNKFKFSLLLKTLSNCKPVSLKNFYLIIFNLFEQFAFKNFEINNFYSDLNFNQTIKKINLFGQQFSLFTQQNIANDATNDYIFKLIQFRKYTYSNIRQYCNFFHNLVRNKFSPFLLSINDLPEIIYDIYYYEEEKVKNFKEYFRIHFKKVFNKKKLKQLKKVNKNFVVDNLIKREIIKLKLNKKKYLIQLLNKKLNKKFNKQLNKKSIIDVKHFNFFKLIFKKNMINSLLKKKRKNSNVLFKNKRILKKTLFCSNIKKYQKKKRKLRIKLFLLTNNTKNKTKKKTKNNNKKKNLKNLKLKNLKLKKQNFNFKIKNNISNNNKSRYTNKKLRQKLFKIIKTKKKTPNSSVKKSSWLRRSIRLKKKFIRYHKYNNTPFYKELFEKRKKMNLKIKKFYNEKKKLKKLLKNKVINKSRIFFKKYKKKFFTNLKKQLIKKYGIKFFKKYKRQIIKKYKKKVIKKYKKKLIKKYKKKLFKKYTSKLIKKYGKFFFKKYSKKFFKKYNKLKKKSYKNELIKNYGNVFIKKINKKDKKCFRVIPKLLKNKTVKKVKKVKKVETENKFNSYLRRLQKKKKKKNRWRWRRKKKVRKHFYKWFKRLKLSQRKNWRHLLKKLNVVSSKNYFIGRIIKVVSEKPPVVINKNFFRFIFFNKKNSKKFLHLNYFNKNLSRRKRFIFYIKHFNIMNCRFIIKKKRKLYLDRFFKSFKKYKKKKRKDRRTQLKKYKKSLLNLYIKKSKKSRNKQKAYYAKYKKIKKFKNKQKGSYIKRKRKKSKKLINKQEKVSYVKGKKSKINWYNTIRNKFYEVRIKRRERMQRISQRLIDYQLKRKNVNGSNIIFTQNEKKILRQKYREKEEKIIKKRFKIRNKMIKKFKNLKKIMKKLKKTDKKFYKKIKRKIIKKYGVKKFERKHTKLIKKFIKRLKIKLINKYNRLYFSLIKHDQDNKTATRFFKFLRFKVKRFRFQKLKNQKFKKKTSKKSRERNSLRFNRHSFKPITFLKKRKKIKKKIKKNISPFNLYYNNLQLFKKNVIKLRKFKIFKKKKKILKKLNRKKILLYEIANNYINKLYQFYFDLKKKYFIIKNKINLIKMNSNIVQLLNLNQLNQELQRLKVKLKYLKKKIIKFKSNFKCKVKFNLKFKKKMLKSHGFIQDKNAFKKKPLFLKTKFFNNNQFKINKPNLKCDKTYLNKRSMLYKHTEFYKAYKRFLKSAYFKKLINYKKHYARFLEIKKRIPRPITFRFNPFLIKQGYFAFLELMRHKEKKKRKKKKKFLK